MNYIKHAFYINLNHRTDRKEYVENQLYNIGIKAERFNAIKLENGALGCSFSHLKCLQIAKENNWEHVFICEDDITFLNPKMFLQQFHSFLETVENWDVVLIAGNIIPPYQTINEACVKVHQCQTTTGYLIKSHYFDILIDNIKKGINLLIKNPEKHVLYAIDKFWFSLQQRDNWYLITPLTVVQKSGYSDIEKRFTNYEKVMTDMNKLYLCNKMNT